ncbi:MAG: ABC transporter substrate-binding protein [Xanthobacteraceae bacterium]|nr:ABC transporter substrate-binding protein [Xanthobacteraceae bacterium]
MTVSAFDRRSLLAGLLATTAVGGAAHGGNSILKIGVISTLSGPGATWGLPIDGAARIAAQEINGRGGLKVGGERLQIEIVAYDDQYKAANAVTAVNRLIDYDGVRFILGPIASVSLSAIKPITESRKVFLFPNSWSPTVFQDARYVFRISSTTREFLPKAVEWLQQAKPGISRVATLAPNDETGWTSQKVQKEIYGKAGYTVVAAELFERQQTDFRALVTRILAEKPESIELDTAPPATAGLIVRQAREAGYNGGFTKFGGFDVAEIVRTAGAENAEGIVGILLADPTSESWSRLKEAYATYHKNEASDFVTLFYDAARILFAGIENAGTIDDPESIKASIEGLSPFPGSLGPLRWGGKENYGIDHQLYTPVFLTEVREGKGRVISRIETA